MKTKINYAILCTAVSLSCLTAFPSFADVTKEDYKTESAQIRAQRKETKAEIDALREANDAVKKRYEAIKEAGELPETITREEWEQIVGLRRQVNAEKAGNNEETVKESGKPAEGEKKNSAVRDAVREGDYETALMLLNAQLEESKAMLEQLQEKNQIWLQIDGLMD